MKRYSTERDTNIDVIYLDYKKDCDKADHILILRQLLEKGIRVKLGKWIHNYLTDRAQAVIGNNHNSRDAHVISGVPQRSV